MVEPVGKIIHKCVFASHSILNILPKLDTSQNFIKGHIYPNVHKELYSGVCRQKFPETLHMVTTMPPLSQALNRYLCL
jgi:hypothetical protein